MNFFSLSLSSKLFPISFIAIRLKLNEFEIKSWKKEHLKVDFFDLSNERFSNFGAKIEKR